MKNYIWLLMLVLSACSPQQESFQPPVLIESFSLSAAQETSGVSPDFGDIVKGSSVADKSFTFKKNPASSEAADATLVLRDNGGGAFSLTSTTGCNRQLTKASEVCYPRIRFLKAATVGLYTGVLEIGAGSALVTLNLRANVIADPNPAAGPKIEVRDGSTTIVSPAKIDFGSLTANQTVSKVITVINTGNAKSAALAAFAVDGAGFVESADGCSGKVLNAGASCTMRIAFASGSPAPPADEERLGNLTSTSLTESVGLKAIRIGTNTPPPVGSVIIRMYVQEAAYVQIQPEASPVLSIGQKMATEASVTKLLLIKNEGTSKAYSQSVFSSDATSKGYTISSNTCTSGGANIYLDPGKSCNIRVVFNPNQSLGQKNITMTFADKTLAINAEVVELTCPQTQHLESGVCVDNQRDCTSQELLAIDTKALTGTANYSSQSMNYACSITSCDIGYQVQNNACVAQPRPCNSQELAAVHAQATAGDAIPNAQGVYTCNVTSCNTGYRVANNTCEEIPQPRPCTSPELAALSPFATAGDATPNAQGVYTCNLTACQASYHVSANSCLANQRACTSPEVTAIDPDGTAGNATWTGVAENYTCQLTTCRAEYHLTASFMCDPDRKEPCDTLPSNATNGYQQYNSGSSSYGQCIVTACANGYNVSEDTFSCQSSPQPLPGGFNSVISDVAKTSSPLALFSDGKVLTFRYNTSNQTNYVSTWQNGTSTDQFIAGTMDLLAHGINRKSGLDTTNSMVYVGTKLYMTALLEGSKNHSLYSIDPNSPADGFKKITSLGTGFPSSSFSSAFSLTCPMSEYQNYIYIRCSAKYLYLYDTTLPVSSNNPLLISANAPRFFPISANGNVWYGSDTILSKFTLATKTSVSVALAPAGIISTAQPGRYDQEVNGILVFNCRSSTDSNTICRSDGTPAGTFVAADIVPGIQDGVASMGFAFGRVYFYGASNGLGNELYRYNPATNGFEFFNLNSGSNSSGPQNFTLFGGHLFFTANDGALNNEVWRTSSATDNLSGRWWDIGGSGNGNPFDYNVAGSYMYLRANPDGTPTSGIFRTTAGSPGGLIADLSSYTSPNTLAAFGDSILMTLTNASIGAELYRVNSSLTNMGDTFSGVTDGSFFSFASDGSNAYAIISRNTSVELVKIPQSGAMTTVTKVPFFTFSALDSNYDLGTRKVFPIFDFSARTFKLMSTTNGTDITQIQSLNLAPTVYTGMSSGVALTSRLIEGGTMFYTLGTAAGLYKTDGTSAGTVQVSSLALASNVVKMGSWYYFLVSSDGLYRTDGTSANTTKVASNTESLSGLIVYKNKLYFTGSSKTIYRSDGTGGGTNTYDPAISVGFQVTIGADANYMYIASNNSSTGDSTAYDRKVYRATDALGSKTAASTSLGIDGTGASSPILTTALANNKLYVALNGALNVYDPVTNALTYLGPVADYSQFVTYNGKLFYNSIGGVSYVDANNSVTSLNSQAAGYRFLGDVKLLNNSLFLEALNTSTGKVELIRYSE